MSALSHRDSWAFERRTAQLRASIERGHFFAERQHSGLTDDALASAIASLMETRPDIIRRAMHYAAMRARVQIAGNEVRDSAEQHGGLTSRSALPIPIGAGGLPTPRTEAGTSHPAPHTGARHTHP